jgi:hypothetical protein
VNFSDRPYFQVLNEIIDIHVHFICTVIRSTSLVSQTRLSLEFGTLGSSTKQVIQQLTQRHSEASSMNAAACKLLALQTFSVAQSTNVRMF